MRTLLFALLPLAPATAGDLLVTSWTGHSIKRYDAATGAYVDDLIASGAGGLANPHSVALGSDGDLFVTSFATSQVLRYDSDGNFAGIFVAAGSGGLAQPTDAFFGPSGDLYVASRGATPGIKRYDAASGAFVDQWIALAAGLLGTETGEFGPDGNFYLALGATSQIRRYHGLTGAFLDVFVQPGDGGLEDPHEMAFGPDGDLYVTSFGNGRVKRYDGTTGAFLDNFVKLSGGLQSPHAIDFRPDGMIYVASFAGGGAGHVRRFDANGDFVDEFVATGSGGLAGAISITFRPEDTLTLATPAGGSAVAWGAEPGEVVHFVLGDGVHARRVADCPFPLWVDRPVLLGSAVADGQGVATLPMVPPPGASGLTLSLQAVTLGSCRTSATAKVVLP